MDWIIANKAWEWVFSGIGVVVLCWIAGKIFIRTKKRGDQDSSNGEINLGKKGDKIDVKAGGNVAIATGKGKSILVNNSKIGVLGDHADIQGDIKVK